MTGTYQARAPVPLKGGGGRGGGGLRGIPGKIFKK